MDKISSAAIQREFGRVRAAALYEPVLVTNHGRNDLVVMSYREFQRLKSRDRVALAAHELSEADLKLLDASRIAPEAADFNDEIDPRAS